MSTVIVDDLDTASGGYGATIDVVAELANGGAAINPHGVAVAESTVTAGAVAFQTAPAPAAGPLVWTTGTPVSLSAGVGATIPQPGAAAFCRVIVTTAVVGGKFTAVVTS
jgi:hypothetical protein